MSKKFIRSVLLCCACALSLVACSDASISVFESLTRYSNKTEKVHKLVIEWQTENEAASQLAIENLLIKHRFDVDRIQRISGSNKDKLNRIKAESQELMSHDEQLTLIKTIKKISPDGQLTFASTSKSGGSTFTIKSKS